MTKDTSNRFGSFYDRVKIERMALKVINQRFENRAKLHGLTGAAINAWLVLAKNENINNTEELNSIAAILKRLSARIDALADQSRTVFSGEYFPMLPSDEILQELIHSCQKYAISSVE